MNLLKDIKNILKDNQEHQLRIEIDWEGVTVYLTYDPGLQFAENCIIPIQYTTVEQFAYVPQDKFCKIYNPSDFGLDSKEVKLISKIMKYLERHSTEIDELCKGFDFQDRECYKKDEDLK